MHILQKESVAFHNIIKTVTTPSTMFFFHKLFSSEKNTKTILIAWIETIFQNLDFKIYVLIWEKKP